MDLAAEMRAALETFFSEVGELLEQMEGALLELADGAGDEAVAAVFRAAHTIKGSAGLFDLEPLVRFTHVVEGVLDDVRAGAVPVSAELVAVLLPCCDHMAHLVERARAEGPGPVADPEGAALLDRLREVAGATPASGQGPVPSAAHVDEPGERLLAVGVRFGPDCLRGGMDPLAFIRFLDTVGEVVDLRTITTDVPPLAELDAEACHLGFEVLLRTAAPTSEVEDVFDFVRDESDITVVDAEALDAPAPASVPAPAPAPAPAGTAAAEPAAVAPERAERRSGDRREGDRRAADAATVRVDAARLDRLIDAVGELVVAGAGARLASGHADEGLRAAVEEVMRLVEVVRDDALGLRMVPIGTTFGRFRRVVHDLAAGLGKQVELVVSGGDTEVDRAMVERIVDPLTHMVRNALDHGLEDPAARAAHGKPAVGTLELRARHEAGQIVVEVVDDGGGIDVDRVRRTAVERGVIGPGDELGDAEVRSLIFEPGFSTAAEVTDLSGRGVGMDVVKRNVTALRGSLEVDSTPGEGTTVRMRLPLTLAIIDGFLVEVGDTSFVVPLDRVVECVALPAGHRGGLLDLRGSALPLVPVRQLLGVGGAGARRPCVVVIEHDGGRAGLVVDSLVGEHQTVVKPLAPVFAGVRGLAGSTILGDGEVALILDVAGLVGRATARAAA